MVLKILRWLASLVLVLLGLVFALYELGERSGASTIATAAGLFCFAVLVTPLASSRLGRRWRRALLALATLLLGLGIFHMTVSSMATLKMEEDEESQYADIAGLLKISAMLGNSVDMANLGLYLDEGRGMPADSEQAAYWYRRAAEQGVWQAQLNYGRLLARQKRGGEALAWLSKPEVEYVTEAEILRGDIYRDGIGVPVHLGKARTAYELAAKYGDHVGGRRLAGLLRQGNDADRRQAVELLTGLARKGDIIATFDLGVMNEHGEAMPQNHAEAARLYRIAAEAGLPEGQLNLAVFMMNGTGVPVDWPAARELLRKARRGSPEVAKLADENLELITED